MISILSVICLLPLNLGDCGGGEASSSDPPIRTCTPMPRLGVPLSRILHATEEDLIFHRLPLSCCNSLAHPIQRATGVYYSSSSSISPPIVCGRGVSAAWASIPLRLDGTEGLKELPPRGLTSLPTSSTLARAFFMGLPTAAASSVRLLGNSDDRPVVVPGAPPFSGVASPACEPAVLLWPAS